MNHQITRWPTDVAYLRESRSVGVKDFVTQLLLRDPTTRLGMDPEIGTLAAQHSTPKKEWPVLSKM